MERPIIITLHGIRTHGEWQEKLGKILEDEGYEHKPFKYGYYDILHFLNPWSNKRMIEKFYTFYSESITDLKNKPNAVAHSFGTFVLAHCLKKREDLKFNKIIFCGSILSKKFDWNTVIARNQINQLRNEFSKLDFWTKIVKYFVKDTGQSGSRGFAYRRPSFFEKRFEFEHSDYFTGNHMKMHWIPFLKEQSPIFNVIHGAETSALETVIPEMRKIDVECYGNVINHEEVALPEGLSKKWISINKDIFTYVLQEDTGEIKGYINAMPLKKTTYEKLVSGEIKDNEITESDIIPFLNNSEVKVYIMSIATKLETRIYRGDLINTVAERLLAGLFKKLIDYWENDNIRVTEFAAIAWTSQGKIICESLGMISELNDRYGHPIYKMNTAYFPTHKKYFLQGVDNLINAYKRT